MDPAQALQGPQGLPATEPTNATSPPPLQAPPPPPAPHHSAAQQEPAACSLAEAALALVAAYADPQCRRALFACSKACQQGVLQATEQFTASLLAYGGMNELRWQRRLQAAGQVLAARGPFRANKLVLRLPTPNPSALQSVLGIAQAAGRAVTELEVLQALSADAEHNGVGTEWLAGLPTTFPNLRTLRLQRVAGVMPPASQLPHLKELHIHECLPEDAANGRLRALCGSIAAYVPQLASLCVSSELFGSDWEQMWSVIFDATSTTLTTFTTPLRLTDGLVAALCEHAPNLTQLGCGCTESLRADRSKRVWAVRELVACRAMEWSVSVRADACGLAKLPQSPGGLRVVPAPGRLLCINLASLSMEGLQPRVRDRLAHWVTEPCEVRMDTSWCDGNQWEDEDNMRGALKDALMQLGALLPAGSVIQLHFSWGDKTGLSIVLDTMSAIAPQLPHVTIYPPSTCEVQDGAGMVYGYKRASVEYKFEEITGISGIPEPWVLPWSWESIRKLPDYEPFVGLSMSGWGGLFRLDELLLCPLPCQQHCEITGSMAVDIRVPYTPEQLSGFQARLEHFTFVVADTTSFLIMSPKDALPRKQCAALHEALRLLRSVRVRRTSDKAGLSIELNGFTLTQSIASALAELPVYDFPVTLNIQDCVLAPHQKSVYKELPSYLPSCYTHLQICSSNMQTRHIIALCEGAAQRSDGSSRLRVSADFHRWSSSHVNSKVTNHLYTYCSDEDRSQVERAIDERGLGRAVELHWCRSFWPCDAEQ